MKAFITGGGGFLGTYIVKALIAKGYEVTSYSRSHYPHLEKIGVKTLQGCLSDLDCLTKAASGHDVFFHTASKVAMWGKTEDFNKTNVEGTKNVIQACQTNGIPHLIYTSTPSVVFGQESLKNVDESLPYPQNSVSRYGASKARAEALVLKANNHELKTVSLRPHLIFGPGDQNLIPRLINKAKKGKLKRIGTGDNLVDVLYVENAADAHVLAWEQLKRGNDQIAGEAFFLGQGPIKLWDFIDQILEHFQVEKVSSSVSFKLAYRLGSLIEKFMEFFRIYRWDPPMTRFVALQLNCDHYFNHNKANDILGWKPKISIEEGLSRL